MAYLLLLALVYSFAIALLFFQSGVKNKSAALVSFGIGFSLLAIGYATQIALGFELNESAARVFYWARAMLALAWLGHGLLLILFPKQKLVQWAGRSLVGASFLALALVAFTQITNAEDWFRPASTIYSQIGDLLATNRPTRWLALLLNIYGLVALLRGAVYLLRQYGAAFGRTWLTILGAIFLILPLYWHQTEATQLFYAVELGAPIVLFLGTLGFLRADSPARETKRRRAAA
jgi:hypothetical protein